MHLYLAVTQTRACAVCRRFVRVRGRACLCYACWCARRRVPGRCCWMSLRCPSAGCGGSVSYCPILRGGAAIISNYEHCNNSVTFTV